MCDGRIQRNQRFPKNPTNGQVPAWNSITKQWEAVNQSGGSGLPDGTNPDDILLWDAIGNQWFSSVSPYTTRDNDETINGDWSFDKPVHYNGRVTDPTAIASPSYGFVMGADMSDNLFYLNSIGGIIRYRTSSISSDVTYTLPNETGTIALRGKTGIHFDSDADISASLQVLKDPANNSLPISVSNSQVSITGASGNTIFNGYIIEMTRNSANYFHASSPGGDLRWTVNGNGVGSYAMNLTSAGNLLIGHTSASARLHVRGDGTNNVARFESSTGINIVSARQSDYSLIFGQGTGETYAQLGLQALNSNSTMNTSGNGHMLAYRSNFNRDWPGPMHSFFGSDQIYNAATQTNNPVGIAAFNGTFGISNVAASTFDYRMMNISYTINNTAVSNRTATGIFLNATETGGGLNGMTHNLITLQRGGINYFNVSRAGLVEASGWSFAAGGASSGRFLSVTNGVFVMYNSGADNFTRLNFGGQDATKPAIQVAGSGLEIRTADGASLTSLSASIISSSALTSGQVWSITYRGTNGDIWASLSGSGATTKVSSAVLWNMTGLPTSRPATVGDLYVATAETILSNGDRVIGIRA